MKRILIVDDDPDIREVTRVAFQVFTPWDVTLADSGTAALEILEKETFDAILLDVSMPDMDGFSVFDRLQADPRTRSLPVILLTAKVLAGDRQRFAEMEIAGMIAKPFDPLALPTRVATILGWELSGKF
jgi:CheY-like chemotaxis protein